MGNGWQSGQGGGSWGARRDLTARQENEIETCLTCPLPECVWCDKKLETMLCPLEQAKERRRKRRDVERLIAAWWEVTNPILDCDLSSSAQWKVERIKARGNRALVRKSARRGWSVREVERGTDCQELLDQGWSYVR